MAGAPIRKERKLKAQAFLEQADAISVICARITGGGTLVDICRERDLHYGTVNAWIQADDDRRKTYAAALDVRKEHGVEHVIKALLEWIDVDITKAFNNDHTLKPINKIPRQVRNFIAGIKVTELYEGTGEKRKLVGHLKEVKFHDKPKGLELMAKHLRMLMEVAGNGAAADTLADLLSKSYADREKEKAANESR